MTAMWIKYLSAVQVWAYTARHYKLQEITVTVSSAQTRPKIYRVPAAKPKPAGQFVKALYEWILQHKPVAAAASVSILALVGVGMQSSRVPEANDDTGKKAEKKFTVFESAGGESVDSGQPFVINGKDQAIIGQITQIPADNQEVPQIKTTTDVDKKANRDLLSVVNKY